MTLKQEGCHEGYSTVDGQTVKDALCLQFRGAGYECGTARSLDATLG